MTLTITDTAMTSDHSAHTARPASSGHGWKVSWLPGQILDRNTAITAMTLADTATERPDRTRCDRPSRPAARRHQPPTRTGESAARPRGSRLTGPGRGTKLRRITSQQLTELPASSGNIA